MNREANEAAVGSEVASRMLQRKLAEAEGPAGRPIEEIINETLYYEHDRLSKADDSKEARADRAFYAAIRHELPHTSDARKSRLVQQIIERYTAEVTGHFNPRVYALAARAMPAAFSVLLNSLSPGRLLGRLQDVPTLDEHIVIQGEVDAFQSLHQRGTIVMVPTHSSNLDSVVMGYAVHQLGLPPLTYGAGLNLFSNPIVGYFMHNLGAYTVDRLKKDPLYKEILKEYATATLEFGYHNLFFPGGTRSRSGAVESSLKRGLLGTSVAAFRNNLLREKASPRIFVIPCTISYPLVLEGSTLIEDYLKEAGKSRYIIVDDEFSKVRRWLDFMQGLFSLDLRIYLTLGEALDPFGNRVNASGDSLDPQGRVIDPGRYLLADGALTDDPERDAQYTNGLAGAIVRSYTRNNVALPTNVVAFAFFNLLWRESPQKELYRFLRMIGPEVSLPITAVEEEVSRVVAELKALEKEGKIRMSRTVGSGDVHEIMRKALRSFGTYHTNTVIERRGVRLHAGDINLIFYYRNRLEGYGLRGARDFVRGRKRG